MLILMGEIIQKNKEKTNIFLLQYHAKHFLFIKKLNE